MNDNIIKHNCNSRKYIRIDVSYLLYLQTNTVQ